MELRVPGTQWLSVEEVRWSPTGATVVLTTAIYRDFLEDIVSGATAPFPVVIGWWLLPRCTITVERRDLTTTLHVRES